MLTTLALLAWWPLAGLFAAYPLAAFVERRAWARTLALPLGGLFSLDERRKLATVDLAANCRKGGTIGAMVVGGWLLVVVLRFEVTHRRAIRAAREALEAEERAMDRLSRWSR